MKHKQLIGVEGQNSAGPAVVIAELHFANTAGESFDHRAGLTTKKPTASDVFEQSNQRCWLNPIEP